MKTRLKQLLLLACAIFITACSDDDSLQSDPFVVAFESLSKNLQDIGNQETIPLVYSETAVQNGSVTIELLPTNAVYGEDFTTIPAAINNTIEVTITSGEVKNEIIFNKLSAALDETTLINFSISTINYDNASVQGNTEFVINSSAALGGSISPELGGPNEGNQVFVDLSSQSTTLAQRDSWDLGFYNGNEFRVTINGSIYMAAKELTVTDIDAVTAASVTSLQPQVAVGTFDPSNAAYVDAPNGNILETAINEISINDADNNVYLINLGYEVGTAMPTVGSVAVAGDQRGWRKIRILRNGNDYVLQYANLDETTHQEVIISKDTDFNLTHFSFNTNNVVSVEPKKDKWDISFTVMTNILPGAGSYGFSDFVTHNRKGSAVSYQVNIADVLYDDFEVSDVIETNFLEDQTTIGSTWRDVFSGTARTDRFYIVKDPNGNIYKLKFLGLTNQNGERGYPEFEYQLLQ
ncbi:HmuY family protein [uncultured Kordia sp.]|uniref:HmuY family protein n=1 Tax=uncultured Kordia sp. TaxID=507699 RepID=UPI0026360DEB|nr:HmuY family protein [uncultured Kordia sp.]